ncbi:MAG TPA: CoA pyrophosphatase [Anaerolineales bacterium]|nr:CoA pyrophosphatase [Anaerolineales bacterium]
MRKPLLTVKYITRRLAAALKKPSEDPDISAFLPGKPRPAAVLIPLFTANEQDKENHIWQILLTRRTNNVADHQGQVAFPGGSADSTDTSLEMTALREAQEEIGLDPSQVTILGRMNHLWTISNYMVTPVVGVIPWPFPIRLEEVEVSRVFSIPLDWLADPRHHEVRYRAIPTPYAEILGREFHPVIYFQTYQDELLWGVSAEITLRLINILYNQK